MRFVVDEGAGPSLARWLREQGHDVHSVYEQSRGDTDESVFGRAFEEDRIIVTTDKDFGELVYRRRRPHKGVVLLRLDDLRQQERIEVMRRLLRQYSDRLEGRFVVVTENRVRLGGPPGTQPDA